jgi:hypothetical protein
MEPPQPGSLDKFCPTGNREINPTLYGGVHTEVDRPGKAA